MGWVGLGLGLGGISEYFTSDSVVVFVISAVQTFLLEISIILVPTHSLRQTFDQGRVRSREQEGKQAREQAGRQAGGCSETGDRELARNSIMVGTFYIGQNIRRSRGRAPTVPLPTPTP